MMCGSFAHTQEVEMGLLRRAQAASSLTYFYSQHGGSCKLQGVRFDMQGGYLVLFRNTTRRLVGGGGVTQQNIQC